MSSDSDYNAGWEQGETDAAQFAEQAPDLEAVNDERTWALGVRNNVNFDRSDYNRGFDDAYLTTLTEHVSQQYRKNTNGRHR